jgi:hypothetical protein
VIEVIARTVPAPLGAKGDLTPSVQEEPESEIIAMSAVPTPESLDETVASGVIAFTPRGEDALDQLATVLSARCSTTPEGIAKVLDQVMHADMTELVDALTAIADASEQRANPDLDTPDVETPDGAARRRLGRPEAGYSADGGTSRGIPR